MEVNNNRQNQNTNLLIYDKMPEINFKEPYIQGLICEILDTGLKKTGNKNTIIIYENKNYKVLNNESTAFLKMIKEVIEHQMPEVPNELKYKILKSKVESYIKSIKDLKIEFDTMKKTLDSALNTYNTHKPASTTFYPHLTESIKLYKKGEKESKLYINLDLELKNRIKEDPGTATSKESLQLMIDSHDDIEMSDLIDKLGCLDKQTTEFDKLKKDLETAFNEMIKSQKSFIDSHNSLKDRIITKSSTNYILYSLSGNEEEQQIINTELKRIEINKFSEKQIEYLKNVFYLISTKAGFLKIDNSYHNLNIEPSCENSHDLKPLFDLAVNWNPCFNIKKLNEDEKLKSQISGFNDKVSANITTFKEMTKGYENQLNKMVDKNWVSNLENKKEDVDYVTKYKIEDRRKDDYNRYDDISKTNILSIDKDLSSLSNSIEVRAKKIDKTISDQSSKRISMKYDIKIDDLKTNISDHTSNTKMFNGIYQWKNEIKHPYVSSQESKKTVEDFTYNFDLFGCLYENGWAWTNVNILYFLRYRDTDYNFIKKNPNEYQSHPVIPSLQESDGNEFFDELKKT